MTDLTFWTLPESACSALPELKVAIRADVDKYLELLGKPPHPHVVLEDHLVPFVERADREGDEDALRRAFDLLERIAAHPDEDLVGALGHAFLEHVEPSLLDRRPDLVGPALARLAESWARRPVKEE